MKTIIATLATLAFFLFSPLGQAAEKATALTLTLPEPVLSESLHKLLPLEIPPPKDLSGTILIKNIDNLKIDNQTASADFNLVGSNIQLNTAVAGHQIRLKLGNVTLEFSVTARLRFDPASQTLFILPQVTDRSGQGEQQPGDIGKLLLGLFNGQEIPVAINKLEPIITNTGSKELILNLSVADIAAIPGALVFQLKPEIIARPIAK